MLKLASTKTLSNYSKLATSLYRAYFKKYGLVKTVSMSYKYFDKLHNHAIIVVSVIGVIGVIGVIAQNATGVYQSYTLMTFTSTGMTEGLTTKHNYSNQLISY